MNNLLKIAVLSICLLLFVNISLAQKAKPKTKAKPSVRSKVDLGKLSGNTYTNDFFELKIEFPLGWLVGDNALESQLQAIVQPQVKAKNPKNQSSFNTAFQRLTPLLGAYRSLPGTNPANSNFKIVVENLQTAPHIKTTADYMNNFNITLKLSELPPGLEVSEVKTEVIDNVQLNYIETTYGQVKKRMYVMVKKRFAVLFTLEYYSQDDYEFLYKSFREADLQYKK